MKINQHTGTRNIELTGHRNGTQGTEHRMIGNHHFKDLDVEKFLFADGVLKLAKEICVHAHCEYSGCVHGTRFLIRSYGVANVTVWTRRRKSADLSSV